MNILNYRKKKLLFLPIFWMITMVMLIFLSISFLSLGEAVKTEEQEVIKLGCSIALTGALSREGNLGKDGYDLWMNTINETGGLEVNGKRYKIEISYYDDMSNAQTGAQLAEKFISDEGIKLILGPFSSGITFAVSNITERYGAVLMSAMGNADMLYNRGYKNIFTITLTPSMLMRPALDLWSKQSPKPKTVAILSKDDVFSLTLAEGARDYAPSVGMDVIYFAKYPAGLQDLSTYISQIKAKNPDVFIATGHMAESLLVVKQSKDLQFRPMAWDVQVGPELPEFRENLGEAAENIFYYSFYTESEKVNWKDPVFGDTANWRKKFIEKYGYAPNQMNGQACSTAVVLGEAIKAAGTTDAAKVREAISNIDIETFFGPVRFDERGVNVGQGIYLFQIQPEKDALILPEAVADGKPIYPMPKW